MTVVPHSVDDAEVQARPSVVIPDQPIPFTPVDFLDGDRAPLYPDPHPAPPVPESLDHAIPQSLDVHDEATQPTQSKAVTTETNVDVDQSDRAYPATIDLAARDVRMVLEEQREQSQILVTKLNILFVANSALLTSLTISRLMAVSSLFSFAEALGFMISFILLVRAYLPRQVAVSPNLEDQKFLERYLALSPEQYQLQMLVNLSKTYNANKQRLDDISQTLVYAAYATLCIAVIVLLHMLVAYSGWSATA